MIWCISFLSQPLKQSWYLTVTSCGKSTTTIRTFTCYCQTVCVQSVCHFWRRLLINTLFSLKRSSQNDREAHRDTSNILAVTLNPAGGVWSVEAEMRVSNGKTVKWGPRASFSVNNTSKQFFPSTLSSPPNICPLSRTLPPAASLSFLTLSQANTEDACELFSPWLLWLSRTRHPELLRPDSLCFCSLSSISFQLSHATGWKRKAWGRRSWSARPQSKAKRLTDGQSQRRAAEIRGLDTLVVVIGLATTPHAVSIPWAPLTVIDEMGLTVERCEQYVRQRKTLSKNNGKTVDEEQVSPAGLLTFCGSVFDL